MTPEMLAFWLAGVIPPSATWLLNLAVRGRSSFQTSCADWSLLFLAFDGAAAITLPDIVCYIPNEQMRVFFSSLAPSLVFTSLTIWIVIVRWLEPALLKKQPCAIGPSNLLVLRVFMWALAAMNLFIHYYLFVRGFYVG